VYIRSQVSHLYVTVKYVIRHPVGLLQIMQDVKYAASNGAGTVARQRWKLQPAQDDGRGGTLVEIWSVAYPNLRLRPRQPAIFQSDITLVDPTVVSGESRWKVIRAPIGWACGLVAIPPEGGKVARAQAVSPQVESCNVYLRPAIAPWVESFIDECSCFPNGKYDDQVDQMTQVLNWLRNAVAPPKKPVYRPAPPPSGPRSWMR
jgi:hypothetical protein